MPSKLSNSFMWIGCFLPLISFLMLGYFSYQHSFGLGLLALAVSFVMSLFSFGLMIKYKRKHRHKQLALLQTFQPDVVDSHKFKSFISSDLLTKIAIDSQQQKIYCWIPNSTKGKQITKAFYGMSYTIKTYHFSDLLGIKYIENDYEMTFVQKDTHYTNFLLNKLRENETTSRSTQPPIDKIRSMDLEMIVSDNEYSKYRIRFYYEPYRQLQKDSPKYEALQKEFYNWFNRLKEIICNSEQNIKSSVSTIDIEAEEKKTKITIDMDAIQPFLYLKEAPQTSVEETLEEFKDESEQEETIPKPTSYFDQIVEKNRRQLRGEYTEE